MDPELEKAITPLKDADKRHLLAKLQRWADELAQSLPLDIAQWRGMTRGEFKKVVAGLSREEIEGLKQAMKRQIQWLDQFQAESVFKIQGKAAATSQHLHSRLDWN